MSLAALLEIVIALALLYLLFSQITLSVMELWAGVINRRGAFLYKSLQETLGPNSTDLLYDSTPIKTLYRQDPFEPWSIINWLTGKDLGQPTYIGASVFVQAVLEATTLAQGLYPNTGPLLSSAAVTMPASLAPFNNAGGYLPITTSGTTTVEPFRALFTSHLCDAALTGKSGQETEKLTANITAWYDDFQRRLTGRYKRKLRWPLFFIGLALAVLFNINTLSIIAYLKAHPADRQQAVALATQFVRAHPVGVTPGIPVPDPGKDKPDSTARRLHALETYVDTITTRLQGNGLPIGWWIKKTPVTDSTDANALPNNFYVFKPGGIIERLPLPVLKHLQAVDTIRLEEQRKKVSAIDKYLAKAIATPMRDAIQAFAEAQPGLTPPINNPKLVAAHSAVKKCLHTLKYAARHYITTKPTDSTTLVSAISDYQSLLNELEKAKPVRWTYAPYYLHYHRPDKSAQEDSLQRSGGSAQMTYQPWERKADNLLDPSLKEYKLVDGQSEFAWRAAGNWWSALLLGWPLTAFALMLGAPFWFDILCRVVNIRNVGIKPSRTS